MGLNKKILQLIAVNTAIFLSLLIIADLLFGRWIYFPIIDDYEWTCYESRLHHNYCKNITFDRMMGYKDGGQVIRNYIGNESIRVQSEGESVITEDYDIVNIGDSFLQAEEIPYDQTLSFYMEKKLGKKVLQVGYSSWSMIQFYRWIMDHELKKGAIVNVFTMINDFTPSYDKSNIRYHENIINDEFHDVQESNGIATKKARTWKDKVAMHSFIYSRFNHIRNSYSSNEFDEYTEFNGQFSAIQIDCSLLRKQDSIAPSTHDYATYSFDSNCWDDRYFKAADSVIQDMELLKANLEERGIQVNFYLIPPGWSFNHESTIGKMHPYYKISKNSVIGIQGLVKYIKNHSSIEIIDLQSVINKLKSGDDNQWYFSVDGHWTGHAHRSLGAWLSSNLTVH